MPASFADEVISANDSTISVDLGGQYNHHPLRIKDDIVISGFSGRFPESSNIAEFKKNLFDGIDMVNDDPRRWKKGLYGLPDRIGKIKDEDLSVFDQHFFGVHQKQAECMDPQMRLLLETTYEAIIDAGINPVEIRGSRTGVYVGLSNSETEQHWTSDPDLVNGYGLTGCARAMFSNRISYTFDFKGPSYSLDTACSSSIFALEQAFSDIREGKCDAAVVAGVCLILKPTMSLQFRRLNMLSTEGMCRTFDAGGNGYVRSDACGVLLLQRSSHAKRVYATVMNIRTNCDGYKEQGITFPEGQMQNKLIRETYEEINMDPSEVTYLEAHGTGTKVGDPQEVNSFTDYFCKNRKSPLLIGSVKSNMGHSEPASGVCAIAKVLIAMEAGAIPANLHYNTPNSDLKGLIDGRLKVVDKNTPWQGGIVALNSFGFGGANGHVILMSNPKPKVVTPRDGSAKLLVCSGRTFEAVETMLESAVTHRNDDEYLTLINDIHSRPIPLHGYRGYCVLNSKGSVQREIIECQGERRPVWFLYSGMGSQWASMGMDLMHFEVFNKSIHRCAEVLRAEGIDLINVLTKSTEEIFENILNSFVSIAAMQVALTDLLVFLNIKPDGIIGHSVGELGCAYADGCFTAEQTVLAAYWRGKSILDTQLQKGKMAAVGLSWEDAHLRLPSDCFPVCHNSADNTTISGPEKSIDVLIQELTAEGVFARAVNSSGYAFHSKYIADAGPKLRKSLEKIIPNAKNRTSRWLSTSIPESAWNSVIAKQSSAAYHVNNLLSPVLFHEAVQHIPKNVVCIEVAPHGLLQAIMKRSLGSEALNVGLVKRGHDNNIAFFLNNIGKLYTAGLQPQVMKLCRPIKYPVGRGTPMLNSIIGWDHSHKWFVPKFGMETSSGETIIEIDLSKDEHQFLAGHNIDGRILFPATGYMTLAWMAYSKMRGSEFFKTPVVLEDVVFHRATILNKESVVKFGFNYFEGTGAFEICEGGNLTVSGKISIPEEIGREELPLEPLLPNKSDKELSANDVYKELRLRGYDYDGIFRGIVSSDAAASTGKLQWADNWISFMDTMLQFSILSKNVRELYLPTRLQRAVIDPQKHLDHVSKLLTTDQITDGMPICTYGDLNVVKCGGVELRGLRSSLAQRRPTAQSPTVERYTFIPNVNVAVLHENAETGRMHALTIAIQMIIENAGGSLKIKGVEYENGRNVESLMASKLVQLIEGEPTLTAEISVVTGNDNREAFTAGMSEYGVNVIHKDVTKGPVEKNCHLVYGVDLFSNTNSYVLDSFIGCLREDGFLISDENARSFNKSGRDKLKKHGFTPVLEQTFGDTCILVVAKLALPVTEREHTIVEVTEHNFDWLENLKTALANAHDRNHVYIVCNGEELFGAVGFMNCVKNETGGRFAHLYYIQDKHIEPFAIESTFFANQLQKNLKMNVYKNGSWGTFRHLKLESDSPTLQVEHAYVNALVKGDLSSLKWIEGPLGHQNLSSLDNDMDMCTVYCAPINFRDVMLSSGKLSADALPGDLGQQDCVLGLEFSGRDSIGNRVMAMVPAKSLATTCLASKNMMWSIPDNWTMEEASTVPCVYSTVYYALVVRGQMKRGEKILIHAGSGGVGQAAISVALHCGLTVFTTVGSKEKREFLKRRFPQLSDDHIGNSRDCSFEQMIMRMTQGRGVDVILNSLAEEKLQASVRCLGVNGRFLEIGKFDLSNNNPLGMSVFLKNISFHGILLDSVMGGEKSMQEQVVHLVAEGIRSGAVRPLPVSAFGETQVEQAFRFMASGKHIGKVVIRVRDEEQPRGIVKPPTRLVNAVPRTYMHTDKSYIVVGGLGGFGLELTNWLVGRGAKNIILTSRSGIKSGYQGLMVARWQERGCHVTVDTNDVTTAKGCKRLLDTASKQCPIGGIFNLAAVLRDGLLENQTVKDFEDVCRPKVAATKFLDEYSRTMCPELDYFVCFSSVSCGRGNVGQTNYGLANSAMERICEHRQASGFPGTAIQWGAIGDTGLVIEHLGDNNTVIGGTLPQRIHSCLQTLDILLQQPHPVLTSMVVAEKRKTDQAADISLVDHISNILGLRDLKNIQETNTLGDLGMDSLMGAEIKQVLERNYDLILSAQDIRQLTFKTLRELNGKSEATAVTAQLPSSKNGTSASFGDGTQVVFTKELVPKQSIVKLKAMADKDSKKRPIFFVAPIEGNVAALKHLAEGLESPVYGLQCTSDAPLTTVEDLAMFHVKEMKSIQARGPYAIAGYSYGALIAFVMALQLEQQKESVQLVMLDGAPKYVNWYTQNFKQRYSNAEAENDHNEAYGLGYFSMVVANVDFGEVSNILLNIPTWDRRVAKCAEIIAKKINQPEELIIKAATSFYQKLDAADKYESSTILKCNVTLVKPTENYAKLEEDYGLNEVCEKNVEVFTVEGNHRSFLVEERSVKTIVKILKELV